MKICVYGAGAIGGYLGIAMTDAGATIVPALIHQRAQVAKRARTA